MRHSDTTSTASAGEQREGGQLMWGSRLDGTVVGRPRVRKVIDRAARQILRR